MASYPGCIKGETDSRVIFRETEEGTGEIGRAQERNVIVYHIGDIHPDLCVALNKWARGSTVYCSRERR